MRQRLLDAAFVAAIRVGLLLALPLLAFAARTRRGRLIGLWACCGWTLPLWFVVGGFASGHVLPVPGAPVPPRNILYEAVAVLSVSGFLGATIIAFALCLFVLVTSPVFRSDPSPGVHSLFLGPRWPRGWQLALPPEEDALWLGAWLGTRLDPRIPRAEARRIRAELWGLLDEVAERPEYRDLAPPLPLVWWGRVFRPDHGHFLAYVPDHADGERLGLLVFLHGHGGNAVALLHCWRRFADRHRFGVVCPSFGYGNWEHPASAAAVDRAVSLAADLFPVDGRRVVLAGLSQGGAGVARAGAAAADRFAGLVFVSATMEPAVLGSPAFADGWTGRPVLVIQGAKDRHVRPATVSAAVTLMRGNGADVTEHVWPDESHFLFFARRDEVDRQIAEWVEKVRLTPAGSG